MSWIQQNANNYIHSNAPFSLQYIGSSWYLIDNRDQSKAIPFNDIFDNPVFSVDFSNQSLLAKHFRGEAVNTPATPAFSFQGDTNTGMYRISSDTVGFAANGTKQGEFGVGYGGFTGNVIQVVSFTQNYQTNITGIAFQNLLSASGVVWETSIIPKLTNSKIFLFVYLSAVNLPTNDYCGFRVSCKINTGSYSVIYNPQIVTGSGPIIMGSNNSGGFMTLIIPIYFTPSYSLSDTVTFKIEGATYQPGTTMSINNLRTGTGSNSGHSEIFLLEIAG